MQRFFVEPHQIEEAKHHIHINGTDVNHIKNVLRMKCGEDVWISDGGEKEYHCRIEELGDDEVLLHILYAQEPKYELPNKIYLFQGLPKADKMELIIQKAVELGAFLCDSGRDKEMCGKTGCKKGGKESIPLATDRRECSKTVRTNADPGDPRGYDLQTGSGICQTVRCKTHPLRTCKRNETDQKNYQRD